MGWRREGKQVCYYQNHIRRRSGYYYTLSFQIEAAYDDDVLYLAYCHPYTLTDLYSYIQTLEEDPNKAKRFRRRTLCQTLAGNTVELLTITSFTAQPEAMRSRKGVVISARVHPGESNSSFVMQVGKGLRERRKGASEGGAIEGGEGKGLWAREGQRREEGEGRRQGQRLS